MTEQRTPATAAERPPLHLSDDYYNQRAPEATRLAEAAHYAMCDVSHHDSQTVCVNQRKYELIAATMARFLAATPAPAESKP